MRQAFIIPGRLPGVNEHVKACNTNYRAGNRLKRDAQEKIGWAIKQAKITPIKRPFFLHCTWIEPNMKRDKDNIRFGVKYILDAMQQMDVIANDGWKEVIGFTDTFKVNKNDPRVIVEIEEIDR